MLSDSSVVERLYSWAGGDDLPALFVSCPAGSPAAINLLEGWPGDLPIHKRRANSFDMFTLGPLSEAIRLAEQFHDLRMMSEAIEQGGS